MTSPADIDPSFLQDISLYTQVRKYNLHLIGRDLRYKPRSHSSVQIQIQRQMLLAEQIQIMMSLYTSALHSQSTIDPSSEVLVMQNISRIHVRFYHLRAVGLCMKASRTIQIKCIFLST